MSRAAISGSAAGANPKAMHDNPDFYFKSYTQNSVLNIPERSDAQADRAMIRSINNRIIDLMDEAASTDQGRDNFVTQGLADLERQYSDLK